MISDVTGGNMEQAFWLWKLATPILAVAVVWLLIERRQQRRRAESLWRSIEAYRNEKHELVVKLATAQLDAAEAQCIANILRHRDEATFPCSAVKAADERIAYLTERNEQLILNALATNTREYIKIHPN
jgi:hypothetical protein